MRRWTAAAALALLMTPHAVAETNRVEENLQMMLEASRALTFDDSQEGAYLLEKQETIRSPVAVVFGYADNRVACEQIAAILSGSREAGTFECVPVY